MDKTDLPTGLRARRQRSGRVYFYFSSGAGIKEVPLGQDANQAWERYQALQREHLQAARPNGLFASDLLTQFQKCNARPKSRHAQNRRRHEAQLLHSFFMAHGDPLINGLPNLEDYQEWLNRRHDVRNFDSVRLLRRAWQFMLLNNYVSDSCPWATVPSHRERVVLELADILYAYAPSDLRQLLDLVLNQATPSASEPHSAIDAVPGKQVGSESAELERQLATAMRSACVALANNHRDDLLPSMQELTIQDLFEILASPTRVKHLPRGTIDLTLHRRLAIARMRNER